MDNKKEELQKSLDEVKHAGKRALHSVVFCTAALGILYLQSKEQNIHALLGLSFVQACLSAIYLLTSWSHLSKFLRVVWGILCVLQVPVVLVFLFDTLF